MAIDLKNKNLAYFLNDFEDFIRGVPWRISGLIIGDISVTSGAIVGMSTTSAIFELI